MDFRVTHKLALVRRPLAAVLLLALLAACSGDRAPQLIDLPSTGEGPDEFLVIPNKPLVMPQDVAALPTPTPGGSNLADATPEADMLAALGGNVARAAAGDPALIRHSLRFGVAPDIRSELARADLQFRRDNRGRPLERLFGVSVYFEAYEPFSLDQYAEQRRLQRAGIKTPTAPPEPGAQ